MSARAVPHNPLPVPSLFDDTGSLIASLAAGGMVVVLDDADRENEADLIACAQTITPDQIAFMACYGRGLICLALTAADGMRLNLPLLPRRNRDPFGTAFAVPIDAKATTTTGIAASERAATIRLAADRRSAPHDFITPGHVFPLIAQNGGVRTRPGHTEAGVDLARLAGLVPAAAICEILGDDGEPLRGPAAIAFARRHGLRVGTIADLLCFLDQNSQG